MKLFKKILVCTLILSMVLALFACTDDNEKGGFVRDKNTLNVLVFDGGYGIEYIKALEEAFEAEYPGINVVVEKTDLLQEIRSQVEAGRYVADIIITSSNYTNFGAKGFVHDISDVYTSYPFGETEQTIAEKLGEAADSCEFDGKYYQLPVYTGSTGILYNKVYLDAIYGAGNYDLPLTSNQLVEMCNDIKNRGGWSFVYTNSTEAEYPIWLRDIWTAQYLGYDEYLKYHSLQYTDANGVVKTATSAKEFTDAYYRARESALIPLASVLSNKLGMAPASCSSMSFSQAQAYFVGYTAQTDVKIINGHKGAAFMINGDWLWSEIQKYQEVVEVDVRFMRTPLNSSIIEKLSTVNSEEQLVECVKYIDSVIDGKQGTRPAYLSDADYATLLEARRMVWTTHSQQIATVPSNCSDLGVAKDFLKFMASDSSALAYSDALNGMTSMFNTEICAENKLTPFAKSVNEALHADPIRVTGVTTPYVAYGSLNFFRYYYFTQALYASDNPALTAQQILEWNADNTKTTWNEIVNSYSPN